MKFFCFLIIVVGCGVVTAVKESDALAALEGFGDKCEPKPTKEDFINILRNTVDVPKSTKCLRFCLMEQMDMVVDCKLDPEKLKDIVNMIIDGKDDEAVEITNKCNAKVPCGEKCETAHDRAMCLIDEMKAKKWPFPELEKDE